MCFALTEMSLLRNLVAKHEAIDPRLIAGLWRHIISASIAEQKHDYTIAHSPESASLAQAHSLDICIVSLMIIVKQLLPHYLQKQIV